MQFPVLSVQVVLLFCFPCFFQKAEKSRVSRGANLDADVGGASRSINLFIYRESSPLIYYMEPTNQRNFGRSLTCVVEMVGCYIAMLCLAADWYNFVILLMSVPIQVALQGCMDVGGKTTIYNVLCTMHNNPPFFNHTAVIHIPPTRSEKVTVQTQRTDDSLTNQIIMDIARNVFTHDSFGRRNREGLLERPAIYRC